MTTFILIAFYSYRENYAAWDWDGQGECPQCWKNKGEHEVVVKSNISVKEAVNLNKEAIEELIKGTELGFGKEDNYIEFWYRGYELVALDQEVLTKIKQAQSTSYDPTDPIALSYESGLPEAVCVWALGQQASC